MYICYFFASGPLFGFDTTVSQAYGAKQFRDCGVQLQTALYVTLALGVPVGVFWLSAAPILGFAFNLSPNLRQIVAQVTQVSRGIVVVFLNLSNLTFELSRFKRSLSYFNYSMIYCHDMRVRARVNALVFFWSILEGYLTKTKIVLFFSLNASQSRRCAAGAYRWHAEFDCQCNLQLFIHLHVQACATNSHIFSHYCFVFIMIYY